MVEINGIYRHFKGPLYKVLGVVKHSEMLEDMVVYIALYGDYGLWTRPLNMFEEEIERNGKKVKRFELIKYYN